MAALPSGEMIEVSNSSYKLVSDDPTASLVSPNQFGGRTGSPSLKDSLKQEAHFGSPSSVQNAIYSDLSQFDSLPLADNLESIKCSVTRLRKIKEALDEPGVEFFALISKQDLKRNFEYFIKVLECVIQDERKIMSEDDVLSEVEPDSVPNEVRNWLSMTFTRSVTSMKKKVEEKVKFKSVAQAIRAGIMVDRMLRRMSSSLESNVPSPVSLVLKTLNEWDFEVFSMNECSEGQALRYLGFELMQKFQILSKFKIPNLVMQNFLEAVEIGYSKYKNPYHNLIHAADVLQTTYFLLNNAELMNWLTPMEIFAIFISAIIHDYEHTGTTNNFHMQTKSDMALVYNDRAILENHHVSSTFRLMTNSSYNILEELTREEYKEFRQLVIEMVLATDMSYHFTQLKTIKTMISLNEPIDKPKALSLLLHCADISHPGKKWDLHEQWTNKLVSEFFAQGDKEKELGLPFSPLCDRNNTPVAQSQIGFINFIVEPSFVVMGDMMEKIVEQILASAETKSDLSAKSEAGSDATDTPKSSLSEKMKNKQMDRPWVVNLSDNKLKWQSLAEVERQNAAQKAEEKQAQSNTSSEVQMEKNMDSNH